MLSDLKLEFNIKDIGVFQLVPVEQNKHPALQIFDIVSPDKRKIGTARLNFLHASKQLYGNIFVDLTPEFQRKEILIEAIDLLAALAFEDLKCKCVRVSDLLGDGFYIAALEESAYSKTDASSFLATREDYGLFLFSNLIKKEKHNLLPDDSNLTRALIERVGPIWYKYVSKGVNLSRGGVEHSFITLDQLSQNPNLQTFSLYRSDIGSVHISEDLIKKFLIEDEAFSTSTKIDALSTLFCLGAHEGIVRVARCIYHEKLNNGIFFAQGSYGLLAAALYGIAPVGFQVHLVDTDMNKGEKYSLKSLDAFFRNYPSARTIFIELKTVAGLVYTERELTEIIALCKKYKVFLLVDAAHLNMHFYKGAAFADIVRLFQALDYHEYAVVYTASKTYGLERGRVGFIVVSNFIKCTSPDTILVDLYRNIGAGFDLPFELTSALLNTPLEKRRKFVTDGQEYLRYNMNLMLTYVEGPGSPAVDTDLSNSIQLDIDPEFSKGIKGIKVICKPQAGMQMKVDMKELSGRYFYNMQMFNSEIFSYALNKVAGVVTLHSDCLLNRYSYGMRLSYSYREDVHNGMQRLSEFVGLLTDAPQMNRHMPGVPDAKQYLEESLKAHRQSKLYASRVTFFERSATQSDAVSSDNSQTKGLDFIRAKL